MVVREYELMGLCIGNFGNIVQSKLARKCMFHPHLRLVWAAKLRGFDSIQHFHTPNIAKICKFISFLISSFPYYLNANYRFRPKVWRLGEPYVTIQSGWKVHDCQFMSWQSHLVITISVSIHLGKEFVAKGYD